MNRLPTVLLAIAVLLAGLAVGWIAGRTQETPPAAAPEAERKVLYYRNPMGLADTSPVPKKDAMGMDYLPVYSGEAPPAEPGTVVLAPDKVQALGVRTEPVRRVPLANLVRTSGTVEVDETRQYVIAPRFEGWVERLYANQTGMRVRAGQPLLAVYSPQLAAAQQEYQLADATARTLARTDPTGAASMTRLRDAAGDRLRNWDIGEAQIAGLGNGRPARALILTSPADAVVIDKPIVQGARFEAGETIMRLADLSSVWVVAQVPVAQAGGIAAGQPARFESVALPGETFTGEVTFVQPVVNVETRTVDIRIALPNADGNLRPGLFGTVLLERPDAQPVLIVSRSAVLDTGTRQLVLVQTAPGRFAPRTVVLGQRAGENLEVVEGLAEGELVVVAANFLIDAESNLQTALQGLDAHAGHAAQTTSAEPSPAAGDDTAPDPHAAHRTPAAPPPADPAPDAADSDPDAGHEGH